MLTTYLLRPTNILLLIGSAALFVAAFRDRKSKATLKFSFRGWENLQLKNSLIYFIAGMLVLWVLHLGAQEWAVENLRARPKSAPTVRPSHSTNDQWVCALGISAYKNRDYDTALNHFSQIVDLSGRDQVRWKFYEAMTYLRVAQYQKVVLLQDPEPELIRLATSQLLRLTEQFPEDPLYPTVQYWYAQCLRFFHQEESEALLILEGLLESYGSSNLYRWKEGCLFYSAVIRHAQGDRDGAAIALARLLNEGVDGLLQVIEMGRDDYKVKFVVESFAQKEGLTELIESHRKQSQVK